MFELQNTSASGSTHFNTDTTPNKPPPAATPTYPSATTPAQPSSVQRVFNYLNDFKDRAFGTPQSQNSSVVSNSASPALGGQSVAGDTILPSPVTTGSAAGLQQNSNTSGQQLTPNSRGQALFGMMKGFFVSDKSGPPQSTGSTSGDLDTPMRNTVDQLAHTFPQTHGAKTDSYSDVTNSGQASPGESGDDTIDRIKQDNKMSANRASLSTNYGSFVSPGDGSKDTGAGGDKERDMGSSPAVVTIEDTPNIPPKNKFLANALIKAKKGTPDSPICLDSPVGTTSADNAGLSGTPKSSKTPSNVMKSAGKQTPTISSVSSPSGLGTPAQEHSYSIGKYCNFVFR